MAPTRMSYEAAWALMSEYTECFSWVPVPPDKGDFMHTRIKLGPLCVGKTLEETAKTALQARRQMEALNALACCRGFYVEENPVFWRRAIGCDRDYRRAIGDDRDYRRDIGGDRDYRWPFGGDWDYRCACKKQRALAGGIFSRYQIEAYLNEPIDFIAWATVTCFSVDPASEAMGVRREVHDRLREFLVREPPMLDIQMQIPGWFSYSLGIDRRRGFKSSLFEASRMWRATSPATQERVAIPIGVTVNGATLSDLRECVSLPIVDLREFTVTVRMDDPRTIASELSSLMRELIRVNTVRNMKWYFKRSDQLCLASVFSAIPSMASLMSFTVECEDLSANPCDSLATYDSQSYYLWATYALIARKLALHDVTAGLAFVEGSSEFCARVLQSPIALVDPASCAQLQNLAPLQHGACVTVRHHSTLTAVVTDPKPPHEAVASFVTTEDHRVDAIALCGNRAVIVWPGFGPMWVELSRLQDDWKARPTSAMMTPTRCYSILTSLNCCNDDTAAIASFLKLAGAGLKRMCLREVATEDQADLMRILRSCPRLENLYIASMEVVDFLLTAYDNDWCHVSTLSVEEVGLTHGENLEAVYRKAFKAVDRLIKALARPASRIANKVEQLYIGLSWLWSERIELLATTLRNNRRLETVRLRGSPVGYEGLSEFIDEPLPQTAKSKRGVYTFLLAARRHRILRSLPLICEQNVAEFAATATPTLRHVSWEI